MPKTVNADVDSTLGPSDSEPGHGFVDAISDDVVGTKRPAGLVEEEIVVRVRLKTLLDPGPQVVFEELGHVERCRAVRTLRRAFLSGRIIERGGDVDEFPLKVEAAHFQGSDLADPKAAERGDQEHDV